MQEITKLKTIYLKVSLKVLQPKPKEKKTNNLLTMIDTHLYMYDCNQTMS